jgi:hypothetical protein
MSESKSGNDHIHRVMRMLHMVHELHLQGFQRLRICPYFKNEIWCCQITPTTNVEQERGAMMIDPSVGPIYSAGQKNEYFRWLDDSKDTAEEHAKEFRLRFPEVVEKSEGDDKKYVGWYRKMLAYAERGHLPYGFSESVTEKGTQSESYPTGSLFHLARNSDQEYARGLKTPPGGEGRALQPENCDLIEEKFASEGSRGVDGREYDDAEAKFLSSIKVMIYKISDSGGWEKREITKDLIKISRIEKRIEGGSYINIGEKRFALRPEVAVFLACLLSHPTQYVTETEFYEYCPNYRGVRVRELRSRHMPSEVSDILEKDPHGNGFRIRRPPG